MVPIIEGLKARARKPLGAMALGLVLALLTAAAPGPARAAEHGEPDFLTFGIGYFDAFKDQNAVVGNLEYRSNKSFWYLKPHVGVFGTSDGGAFIYTGVRLDIFLGRRFVFSPNFSPGLYHQGSGKDLGLELEFRSGVEFGYRFDDRARLTLAIHHLSNAGLGLEVFHESLGPATDNPGTETITLYYSLPLDKLIGD